VERRAVMGQRLVSCEWLAEHLGDPGMWIIEVSSGPDEAEYRRGHIPGAIWWYWKDALWQPTDREFPTPEDMAQHWGRIGITPDTTIVVYGSSVQFGAYAVWVLSMAGHADVRYRAPMHARHTRYLTCPDHHSVPRVERDGRVAEIAIVWSRIRGHTGSARLVPSREDYIVTVAEQRHNQGEEPWRSCRRVTASGAIWPPKFVGKPR
jgi:rhodanese-related sulfurtransferase